MNQKIATLQEKIRANSPLIEAITNYVTVNDCANILLAAGASPAMCESYDEAYAFTRLSAAAYLNLGTLTKEQEAAMMEVALASKMDKIPLVLDPVGCAAMPKREQFAHKLIAHGNVTIIKGNIGEIKCLAGITGEMRGVDSIDDGSGIEQACRVLAEKTGAVVVATGAVDTVAGRSQLYKGFNGVPLLTSITGSGCMLGALCAACIAVSPDDPLTAAVCAVTMMGVAAEMAYASAQSPGSFRSKLFDCIYELTVEDLKESGKIHEQTYR